MRYLSFVLAALLSLFILPSTGWAGPPITIDNVTSQCINGVPTITVTIQPVPSWGFWKNSPLYFHNPPGTASTQQWPSNTNPATFNVASSGNFQITNDPSASTTGAGIVPSDVKSYTVATCGGAKKGMTWIRGKSNAQTGTITVGCSGCDAYHGDTVCSELRPLLCIYKPTPSIPLPANVSNADPKNRWSGGIVATTEPVAGNTFADNAAACAYCRDKFGDGWRAAEFHDGGIWNFQAYGGVVIPPTRFWVFINDQKAANCWAP